MSTEDKIEQLATEFVQQAMGNLKDPYFIEAAIKSSVTNICWAIVEKFPEDISTLADHLEVMVDALKAEMKENRAA